MSRWARFMRWILWQEVKGLPAILDCAYGKIMVKLGRLQMEGIMSRNVPEKIIEGTLVTIGIAEAVHLAALFLKLPFSFCTILLAGILALLVLVPAVTGCVKRRKQKAEPFVSKGHVGFFKLFQVYPVLFCIIGFLMILQVIWNYWMHIPYISSDITGETVQTFLTSDGVYTVNPLTGEAFTAGMPMRLKILCLPTLYGAVCKWTGIPVVLLVYGIVPTIVLIVSYLVYSRWALYLFPQEGKKQAFFMLFTVLVYQFGCYAAAMDGYALFFAGYTGAGIRAGIILPYALLCCLQRKWKGVILCLLSEVCVAWTLYGFGYTFVIVLVFLLLQSIRRRLEGREKK